MVTEKPPARVPENKVVMAKLSREEYSALQNYCNASGETVNSVVRRVVLAEVESPVPQMMAGKNVFSYNKQKDNFSWTAVLDDGREVVIADVSTSFVSQMAEALNVAIGERDAYLRKSSKDSVSIPGKLVRG